MLIFHRQTEGGNIPRKAWIIDEGMDFFRFKETGDQQDDSKSQTSQV